MEITREFVNGIRPELEAAINQVVGKHGLECNIGNIKYSNHEFKTKLTISISMSEKELFERYAKQMNIDPRYYGKKYKIQYDLYEIIGLKPNARKNKIIIRKVGSSTEYVTTANILDKDMI